jgi:5,10-methylenetetrahydromethanopterin reductase
MINVADGAQHRAAVGMCFPQEFPPSLVREFAQRLDKGGADQLWIIEDCFFTAGVSLAAAALALTDRLTVGLGVLPAVARNPAITAMEITTLCGLAPGRVLPGIGHGVQSWMGQMGVRPKSPLTALEEVITAVRRLLDGESVTFDGQYVSLDSVQLDQSPVDPPPILAGVRGPKSLALAGRIAGGVVLAEPASPTHVRQSLEHAGSPAGFRVAVFSMLHVAADRASAYEAMAPWLAAMLTNPNVELRALPFFDEMVSLAASGGPEVLAGMPADWWQEIGPIGTLDDAVAHIAALEDAGVDSIGLWPSRDPDVAIEQVADVLRLAAR